MFIYICTCFKMLIISCPTFDRGCISTALFWASASCYCPLVWLGPGMESSGHWSGSLGAVYSKGGWARYILYYMFKDSICPNLLACILITRSTFTMSTTLGVGVRMTDFIKIGGMLHQFQPFENLLSYIKNSLYIMPYFTSPFFFFLFLHRIFSILNGQILSSFSFGSLHIWSRLWFPLSLRLYYPYLSIGPWC